MTAVSKIRQAQVAGQFYPAKASDIREQIGAFIEGQEEKIDALACLLPHAGYQYSGRVASQTVARINIKDKVVLLGPNHTGNGAMYSLMAEGAWQTPLGRVNIDAQLAKSILAGSKYLENDSLAHAREHSLEVELPILQYFKDAFEIIPIALSTDDLTVLKKIGEEIAGIIQGAGLKERTLFVASSDLTHYEPQSAAVEKDKKAIAAILELNPDKLMREIKNSNISMCGYAPVIAMLAAVNSLGAQGARLVKYQTSADSTGDESAVVGYAGIIIN
ncbi:MAG: AmmeMemoRadiSam system protein B [Candidatus Omnitrophica bacterium]|nr:AmmeMemoRadiSam system protein B [Candidatus Omnitrophota bacterium]MDD5027364.1 AmmeMemoRadiSam system protein B [Candidatus Omnitrophota bacterium]MDD5661827.1 AmmeMemoRadiSam system protein B [Candidatus Omnitrophota bacterium]